MFFKNSLSRDVLGQSGERSKTLPYFFMNMPSRIFYAVSGYRSWIADQKAKKKKKKKNIYIHRQFYAIYIHCLIEFNVR